MTWATIGILIGIIIGLSVNFTIPVEYIKYTAVVIIGIIDAVFGAVKAEVTGKITKDKYNAIIFTTGLATNIILAIGITLLGEQLGLDLYLAATVVFTFRIFTNVGKIRRSLVKKWIN